MFNKKQPAIKTLVFGMMIFFLSQSCTKKSINDLEPKVENQSQDFKLKEVVLEGNPSPFLQQKYNAQNLVSELNFESRFYQYKLEYKNNLLDRVISNSTSNKDTLNYYYTASNVTRIDVIEPLKGKTEEIKLTYNATNLLIEISWKKTGFETFKRMTFYYNREKNLEKCDIFYDLGRGGLEKTDTYLYEQFDNKVNPTPNYLLKEMHYLYLPKVSLQKNNPKKVILTGIYNDFETFNTYQYQNTLPTLKTTVMKQTRGMGAGTTLTGNTSYSYY